MMSKRRQEAKDRLRSEHDYSVDLKAEMEIRHLHAKVDQLLTHQWQRLLEIQQIQLELLEEMLRQRRGGEEAAPRERALVSSPVERAMTARPPQEGGPRRCPPRA